MDVRFYRQYWRAGASPILALMAGCAGVSSMTVAQVEKLSDPDLCYLNYTNPVGFVPLEVQRREREKNLVCGDQDQAILEWFSNAQPTAQMRQGSQPPDAMLSRRDCAAVKAVGRPLPPVTTTTPGRLHLFGNLYSEYTSSGTDSRYRRNIENLSGRTVFVRFFVDRGGKDSFYQFAKVPARGMTEIIFNAPGDHVRGLEIDACRAF